jgi:hypothetical protein
MASEKVGSDGVGLRGSKGYRRFIRFLALLAIGIALGASYTGTGTAIDARVSSPAATSCAGNQFTFQNNNSYPIWLGEAYQGSGTLSSKIITPPNSDWEIAAGASVNLCMPTLWTGNFWARTGCDFDSLFSNESDFQTSCTSSSQCGTTNGVQDVCYGGRCLIDCSTGGASLCQGSTGLDNPNAICLAGTGGVSVCSYSQVCQTGDCGGLYQCYGTWDENNVEKGGAPPVSLFEPTSNSATDVNYDVSLVSGYNTSISVSPSSNSCYGPGCVTDLNQVCPSNLQVTATPQASPTTLIPCGSGTYCQSGVCQNNNTCVVGCNQPGIQCSTGSAPPGLECNTAVPAPSPSASPSWTPDGATFADMYSGKNLSGDATPTPLGVSMISGNQGTPTCWGDIDCAPGQSCNLSLVTGFPTGVGICQPVGSPPNNCQTQSDATNHNPCGGYEAVGYPDAQGYTCVSIGAGNTDVACVPPTTAGIGSVEPTSPAASPSPQLYTGVAGLTNPEWQAAALQAGNGTLPFYETFSNACPHEYAWQYDDNAGGLDCDTGTGGANVNMTVSFGGTVTPTPTPTPTPSPSSASMNVLPPRILFGPRKVGTSTKSRFVDVVNPIRSKESITLGSMATGTSQFQIDSTTTTCTNGQVLTKRERCRIGVIFSPSATGLQTDTLTIQSNAANQPRTVHLQGRGR